MSRTKILATLGPATDENVLREMIRAGLNAVRCNFSHGTQEDHAKRIQMVRRLAKSEGSAIGVLADLQGPKIRVARFKDKEVRLVTGDKFILDASMDLQAGDATKVGLTYKKLPEDVSKGDILLLDDGKITLEVTEVSGACVTTIVKNGGKLSDNKGINKLGGGLTADALTEKDRSDIKAIGKLDVDYVAISFPRDADDVRLAIKLLKEAGSKAGLIAKIERAEALHCIDDIINASDGIMVARGDLSVEIGKEEVPGVQKTLIKRARELDKIVITATQMMESMIYNSTPTNAEVSDVANAILDGTDAVMLSAETATGNYPVKVIQAMRNICIATERHPDTRYSEHRIAKEFQRIDEAIAMATMYAANHLNVKAILSLTESGASAVWMSRINSHLPIFAFTRHVLTHNKMTLCRGVVPIEFDSTTMPRFSVNQLAIDELKKRGFVQDGDLVILTSGDHMGEHGGTNKIKVVKVGKVV
ncbi:MAG: pyruvate kinase [Thiotrichales bacterium]|nr:MAG: pyruvate kinase [Thiotrichales bacterium]